MAEISADEDKSKLQADEDNSDLQNLGLSWEMKPTWLEHDEKQVSDTDELAELTGIRVNEESGSQPTQLHAFSPSGPADPADPAAALPGYSPPPEALFWRLYPSLTAGTQGAPEPLRCPTLPLACRVCCACFGCACRGRGGRCQCQCACMLTRAQVGTLVFNVVLTLAYMGAALFDVWLMVAMVTGEQQFGHEPGIRWVVSSAVVFFLFTMFGWVQTFSRFQCAPVGTRGSRRVTWFATICAPCAPWAAVARVFTAHQYRLQRDHPVRGCCDSVLEYFDTTVQRDRWDTFLDAERWFSSVGEGIMPAALNALAQIIIHTDYAAATLPLAGGLEPRNALLVTLSVACGAVLALCPIVQAAVTCSCGYLPAAVMLVASCVLDVAGFVFTVSLFRSDVPVWLWVVWTVVRPLWQLMHVLMLRCRTRACSSFGLEATTSFVVLWLLYPVSLAAMCATWHANEATSRFVMAAHGERARNSRIDFVNRWAAKAIPDTRAGSAILRAKPKLSTNEWRALLNRDSMWPDGVGHDLHDAYPLASVWKAGLAWMAPAVALFLVAFPLLTYGFADGGGFDGGRPRWPSQWLGLTWAAFWVGVAATAVALVALPLFVRWLWLQQAMWSLSAPLAEPPSPFETLASFRHHRIVHCYPKRIAVRGTAVQLAVRVANARACGAHPFRSHIDALIPMVLEFLEYEQETPALDIGVEDTAYFREQVARAEPPDWKHYP